MLRLVNSSIVGVWRLISENAVRGARPSYLVKISKMQARHTSVVYSVTVPLGKPERSSSRLGFVATGEFNHRKHVAQIVNLRKAGRKLTTWATFNC